MKRRFALYYYEVSDGEDTMQFNAPTHYVDISGVLDTKKAACFAHASQNPDFFYRLQDTVATFRGLSSGYNRAEAFLMQTGSPFDIFAMNRIDEPIIRNQEPLGPPVLFRPCRARIAHPYRNRPRDARGT